MGFLSMIGVLAVVFVGLKFIFALGKRIPILELLLLIAGAQWIVGPIIEYQSGFDHFRYHMYVDETAYINYVVPAYLVLCGVIFFAIKNEPRLDVNLNFFDDYPHSGIILFVLGAIFGFVENIVPESVRFVFYLLGNFKYIGALILLFSPIGWHRYVFYGTLIYLFGESLQSGLFHDFILWATFFYMFWAYKVKPSVLTSLSLMFIGFLVATGIQLVKADFRTMVWNGYTGNKAELFVDILVRKISGGFVEDKQEQGDLNVRLNQGWIISAIMQNTPKWEPYAEGETVVEAVYASVFPRFLIPEKRKAGGVKNFERFTGLQLNSSTSMGISVLGEGYANYGIFGGIVFMGIFGLVLAFFWKLMMKWIEKLPIILFFLPLFWLQVVKAETELSVVLNHLVKSILLVLVIFWISKNIFNWHFENE